MRWNILENVLLFHITSSFIKREISEYIDFLDATIQISQFQLQFWLVTIPTANPLAWSVHLRTKIIGKQIDKLLRVVFLNGSSSQSPNQTKTTLEGNPQLTVPNLSHNDFLDQLSSRHLVSAPELRWMKRNHGELEGDESCQLLRSEPASAAMKPLHFWRASPANRRWRHIVLFGNRI